MLGVRYPLPFCCPFGQRWARAAASAGGVDGVATAGFGELLLAASARPDRSSAGLRRLFLCASGDKSGI